MNSDIIQGSLISFFALGAINMICNLILGGWFKIIIKNIQIAPMELKLYPALISYMLMGFGLYYFIIFKNATTIEAGILGMIIAGFYEFMNFATFKKWDIVYCIFDIIWHGIIFVLAFRIVKLLM